MTKSVSRQTASAQGLQLHVCRYSELHIWRHALHSPFWRVMWCRENEGHAEVRTESSHVIFRPDVVVFLPPNVAAHSEQTGPAHMLYAHFNLLPDRYALEDLIVVQVDEALQERICSQVDGRGVLSPILMELVGLGLGQIGEPVLPQIDGRVQRCIERMQENLSSPLGNEQLARHVSLSMASLSRLFVRDLGMPPQQYYLRQRIERACSLLYHTNESIESIAESCGFWDRFYFSRVFKRHLQSTPAAFRRNRGY